LSFLYRVKHATKINRVFEDNLEIPMFKTRDAGLIHAYYLLRNEGWYRPTSMSPKMEVEPFKPKVFSAE